MTQAGLHEDVFEEVKAVLVDTLQLGDRADNLKMETPLLGNIPELDSMAVVTVITSLEERFGIMVEDDDDLAGAFESLGSLVDYVIGKSRPTSINIA